MEMEQEERKERRNWYAKIIVCNYGKKCFLQLVIFYQNIGIEADREREAPVNNIYPHVMAPVMS